VVVKFKKTEETQLHWLYPRQELEEEQGMIGVEEPHNGLLRPSQIVSLVVPNHEAEGIYRQKRKEEEKKKKKVLKERRQRLGDGKGESGIPCEK